MILLIIKFIILKYQYKITIIRIMTIVRENQNCSIVSKNQNYIISLKYSGSKNKDWLTYWDDFKIQHTHI